MSVYFLSGGACFSVVVVGALTFLFIPRRTFRGSVPDCKISA